MAGRKKAEINWKTVDGLLKAGCTGTEVAAHLGIHPDTLYNHVEEIYKTNFSAYSQTKRESGDALLKAAQFKKAVNELDNTMLVWLGKQRLGQSDKKEVKLDTEVTQTVYRLPDGTVVNF